jgi:hypothetical protein
MEYECLFGEIAGVGENAIIRIAWEAVRRRREAAAKQGRRLQLDGTVGENGYVVYNDYNEYMETGKQQEELKLGNWDIGRVSTKLGKFCSQKDGWIASTTPKHDSTHLLRQEKHPAFRCTCSAMHLVFELSP